MKTEIEITVAIKSESGKISAYKSVNVSGLDDESKEKHYVWLCVELRNYLHDLAESKDLKDLVAALSGDQEIRILIEPSKL